MLKAIVIVISHSAYMASHFVRVTAMDVLRIVLLNQTKLGTRETFSCYFNRVVCSIFVTTGMTTTHLFSSIYNAFMLAIQCMR